MAKGSRNRALPSTPGSSASRSGDAPAGPGDLGGPAPGTPTGGGRTSPAPAGAPGRRGAPDPDRFLVEGTRCRGGHPRGRELDSAALGRVPSRRAAWRGFILVLWCAVGVGVLVAVQWRGPGSLAVLLLLPVLVLWLAFSAVLQRRAGHRGRCWRVRTWRHAWGGLLPFGGDS